MGGLQTFHQVHRRGADWRQARLSATATAVALCLPQVLDGLTDGRQATEVAIAADVLNRTLELGRPEYVRTA